jgi:hypothetical protein
VHSYALRGGHFALVGVRGSYQRIFVSGHGGLKRWIYIFKKNKKTYPPPFLVGLYVALAVGLAWG